ncbi:hypothetical protein LTR27_004517 [Elasticomyces elasticus]|nr:hypothetical protein LTR27_004517 [Elasticomyces elasticus]
MTEMLTSHTHQIKPVPLHFFFSKSTTQNNIKNKEKDTMCCPLVSLFQCGHEQVVVNKCRDAERTQRECGELELSEDPIVIVMKERGCGFLLGTDEYYGGGKWCLSVVPMHERISGARKPKVVQERAARRDQESEGPLTEQERQSFGDYVTMMNYYFEGRLYQERR